MRLRKQSGPPLVSQAAPAPSIQRLRRDLEAAIRSVRWNAAPGVMRRAVFHALQTHQDVDGKVLRQRLREALAFVEHSCNRPAQAAEALRSLQDLKGAPADTEVWLVPQLSALYTGDSALPMKGQGELLTLDLAAYVLDERDRQAEHLREPFRLNRMTPADRVGFLRMGWTGAVRLLGQVSHLSESEAGAALTQVQRRIARSHVSDLSFQYQRGPDDLEQAWQGLQGLLKEGVFSGLPGDVQSRTEAARTSASLMSTLKALKPATPRQYEQWLQRYIEAGNRPTHFYDYELGRNLHTFDGTRISLPVELMGSSALSILAPRPATPVHALRGLGHCQVYGYDAQGKASCHHKGFPFVPLYADAGLGFKHLVPPERQQMSQDGLRFR